MILICTHKLLRYFFGLITIYNEKSKKEINDNILQINNKEKSKIIIIFYIYSDDII
jgi:hypothetical protein